MLLVKTSDFRVAKFVQFGVFVRSYHTADQQCLLPTYQQYCRKRRNASPVGSTPRVWGFTSFCKLLRTSPVKFLIWFQNVPDRIKFLIETLSTVRRLHTPFHPKTLYNMLFLFYNHKTKEKWKEWHRCKMVTPLWFTTPANWGMVRYSIPRSTAIPCNLWWENVYWIRGRRSLLFRCKIWNKTMEF